MSASETDEPRPLDLQPAQLTALRTLRKRAFKGVEAILFVCVVALLGLVFLQVLSRYALQISLPWTEEAARVSLLWTVMLGAAIAMERREHYAITVVSDLLPQLPARVVGLLANAIALVFLVVFCALGIRYAGMGMRASYIALGIPRGWVYLALPTGSFLIACSLIMQSLEILFRVVPSASGQSGEASRPDIRN